MVQEHPFAHYIRIIAKGPRLSRPLTREETRDATTMILNGEVDPMQLGAFLCVLRVRTEVPDEGAGFIDAVRASLKLPENSPSIDLDWPSYAGKKRQLPYYVLAALALAQSGVKIFMHGGEGHTEGRVYTSQTLEALGVAPATSLKEAAHKLQNGNFAYLTLDKIAPKLQVILDSKSILGVRTPVNTFARMINAFGAPCVLQAITHGAYRETHRDTALLLGQKNMCVFKGEGGEIERRPNKPVLALSLKNGTPIDEEWPAIDPTGHAQEDDLDLSRLRDLWAGKADNPYGENAVIGTMAMALYAMGRADTQDNALTQAKNIWQNRTKDTLPYANA